MDRITSPLLWFGVMVLAGSLLYLWSSRTAPRFSPTGLKAKAYTGGERIPGQAYRPGYAFFHVALFFTLLHVAAVLVATAPADIIPWAAIAYLGVVALAVAILRWS